MLAVLEGYPFSGKSSLLRHLSRSGHPLRILPEEELRSPDHLPGNAGGLADAIEAQDWYSATGVRRYAQAMRWVKDGETVILERGYYSEIAYAAAYSRLLGFRLDEYVRLKVAFLRRAGLLTSADACVWMQPTLELIRTRRPMRRDEHQKSVLPDFWFTQSFLDDYCKGFLDYVAGEEPMLKVVELDPFADVEANGRTLLAIVDDSRAGWPSQVR